MSRLKLGIIGLGQRVEHGFPFRNAMDKVEIVAACDNRPERLENGKQIYEKEIEYQITGYSDYKKMYEKAGIEGVFIVSPNYLHKEMTVSAFDAGINVLCEKPMALTLAECDRESDSIMVY